MLEIGEELEDIRRMLAQIGGLETIRREIAEIGGQVLACDEETVVFRCPDGDVARRLRGKLPGMLICAIDKDTLVARRRAVK